MFTLTIIIPDNKFVKCRTFVASSKSGAMACPEAQKLLPDCAAWRVTDSCGQWIDGSPDAWKFIHSPPDHAHIIYNQ